MSIIAIIIVCYFAVGILWTIFNQCPCHSIAGRLVEIVAWPVFLGVILLFGPPVDWN